MAKEKVSGFLTDYKGFRQRMMNMWTNGRPIGTCLRKRDGHFTPFPPPPRPSIPSLRATRWVPIQGNSGNEWKCPLPAVLRSLLPWIASQVVTRMISDPNLELNPRPLWRHQCPSPPTTTSATTFENINGAFHVRAGWIRGSAADANPVSGQDPPV